MQLNDAETPGAETLGAENSMGRKCSAEMWLNRLRYPATLAGKKCYQCGLEINDKAHI